MSVQCEENSIHGLFVEPQEPSKSTANVEEEGQPPPPGGTPSQRLQDHVRAFDALLNESEFSLHNNVERFEPALVGMASFLNFKERHWWGLHKLYGLDFTNMAMGDKM